MDGAWVCDGSGGGREGGVDDCRRRGCGRCVGQRVCVITIGTPRPHEMVILSYLRSGTHSHITRSGHARLHAHTLQVPLLWKEDGDSALNTPPRKAPVGPGIVADLERVGWPWLLRTLDAADAQPSCTLRLSGSGATLRSVKGEIIQRLRTKMPTLAGVLWDE